MRRLWALVRGLPDTSATHRALAGSRYRWGHAEDLAALNAELLHAVWRVLVTVNSKSSSRKPEPLRIPRPGEDAQPRIAAKPEMVAFFRGGGPA